MHSACSVSLFELAEYCYRKLFLCPHTLDSGFVSAESSLDEYALSMSCPSYLCPAQLVIYILNVQIKRCWFQDHRVLLWHGRVCEQQVCGVLIRISPSGQAVVTSWGFSPFCLCVTDVCVAIVPLSFWTSFFWTCTMQPFIGRN